MNMFILDSEIYARSFFFFLVFTIMALWELAFPRRILKNARTHRWFINLTVTFLNPVILRLLLPLPATGVALIAKEKGWGLFNNLPIDSLTAGILAIILLDLAIYLQHLFFHYVNFFWRFHRVHHTDLDIDVTTGARFHPVEIILSMVIKITIVIITGAPAWSVLAFEIILNSTSMFNHSNVLMPLHIDKILRKVIVTPDFHRVHHSVLAQEHNRNFGFNLSLWDRLFGTYQDQPEAGHKGMTIGLSDFREANRLTLPYLLALPFTGNKE